MFDVTLTDIDFKRDFVNQHEDWLQDARPVEPDLDVDGLNQSLLARILALFGLA